jgi:hypothetical protein
MKRDDTYFLILTIVAILALALGIYLSPSESLTAALREFGGW